MRLFSGFGSVSYSAGSARSDICTGCTGLAALTGGRREDTAVAVTAAGWGCTGFGAAYPLSRNFSALML